MIDIPDGIIGHLTRQCGRNVHDAGVVEVTSGSLTTETEGVNPYTGAYGNDPFYAAKNAVDLAHGSRFTSAFREKNEAIRHTKNNWLCYDFKARRIAPTHYTIRAYDDDDPPEWHLMSWAVETSTDGKTWREVDRQEDTGQLNGRYCTGTFAVADGRVCRFIRLVNIGRNHCRNDCMALSAWEIFGSLME